MKLKKNNVFGIDGYNLPITQPYKGGRVHGFPKEKGKNFADVAASYVKYNTGPGGHDVKLNWIRPGPKNIKGGPRNTFLDQIYKT